MFVYLSHQRFFSLSFLNSFSRQQGGQRTAYAKIKSDKLVPFTDLIYYNISALSLLCGILLKNDICQSACA